MKKISIIILFLFLGLQSIAQVKPCGVNDKVEPNFSEKAFEAFTIAEQSLRSVPDILLPISVHIIQHDFGFGGLNTSIFYNALDTMNAQYAFMGVEFFVCGDIEYISNTELWDFTDNEENQLTPYLVPNTINVFFVRTLETSSGDELCGYAYFPWAGDLVMMQNGCTGDGATFAHELGHYLGLYHTHAWGELVNGSNCSSSGDRCCDTPADPLLGQNNVDFDCNYTGTETDANGDFYMPMVSNLMSYAPSECAYEFTDDQKDRVRYYATTLRDYLTCNVTSSIDENVRVDAKLYPNPATNELFIESSEEIEKVTILDVSNKEVLSKEMNGYETKTSLTINRLTKGSYLVQVSYKSGKFSREKFIKQ